MSKGLSAYQKVLLELLKKKGSMNVLELSQAVNTLKLRKKHGGNDTAWPYSTVDEIPQPQAVYRLMASLEKRGLVARLMHRRPAVWYYVDWDGDTPDLRGRSEMLACADYNHVMYRMGEVRFTTKGRAWIISKS